MRINPVQPCPSLPLVPEKSGQFEDLKVPRGRWPCVLEHVGYLAGRHRTALEVHRQQDPATHRMGQRREYRLVRIQPLARFFFGHDCNLAQRLNIVKLNHLRCRRARPPSSVLRQ
jgi:hypothetical protein